MATSEKKPKIDATQAALAVMGNASPQNEGEQKIRELALRVLGAQLQEIEDDKAQKLVQKAQQAKNAAEAARGQEEQLRREQSACSHMTPRGETRLAGQYMTGTRETGNYLVLTCQRCAKMYSHPPQKGIGDGQSIPQHLAPLQNEVGGAVMQTSAPLGPGPLAAPGPEPPAEVSTAVGY
jgi:hypothetical protein